MKEFKKVYTGLIDIHTLMTSKQQSEFWLNPCRIKLKKPFLA